MSLQVTIPKAFYNFRDIPLTTRLMVVEENSINPDLKLCECGKCDEWIPKINKLGKPARFKHGHNRRGLVHPNSIRRGPDNNKWQGGFFYIEKGYKYILKPDHPNKTKDGYVLQHRLIYENYLSILFDEDVYIPKKWEVHHINKQPNDNRLINLELLHHNEHSRVTGLNRVYKKMDMSDRRCVICGTDKTYLNKNPEYYMWYKSEDGFLCGSCYYKERYFQKTYNNGAERY